jgi:hypothetical protein
MSEKNTLETIIKWVVVAILAVVALKIVFLVLGTAMFLGNVLLFKVLPAVLVIWLVLKAVEWFRGGSRGTAPAPAEPVDPLEL